MPKAKTKKSTQTKKSKPFYHMVTKNPVATGVALTTGVLAAGAVVALSKRSNRRRVARSAGRMYEAVASRVARPKKMIGAKATSKGRSKKSSKKITKGQE